MKAVDFRKLQEGVADMIIAKDEIAKATYGLYAAHIKAGFTKKEAMEITKHMIKTGE